VANHYDYLITIRKSYDRVKTKVKAFDPLSDTSTLDGDAPSSNDDRVPNLVRTTSSNENHVSGYQNPPNPPNLTKSYVKI